MESTSYSELSLVDFVITQAQRYAKLVQAVVGLVSSGQETL